MSSLEMVRTPLHAQTAPANLAVTVEEAPLVGMITLRGDLASPAMAAAVSKACGAAIPAQRRFEQGTGADIAVWMSPDELLLLVPYAEAETRAQAASAELAGEPHLAVNVSDARAVIRVSGAGAREVLAKGAPVDLSAAAFSVGDVRRTRIETIAAGVWMTSDNPDAFTVVCFRSVSAHLWMWLTESARANTLPGVL